MTSPASNASSLQLVHRMLAHANARRKELDLPTYQALSAVCGGLEAPYGSKATWPEFPEFVVHYRIALRSSLPETAAAMEREPRVAMLKFGDQLLSIHGDEGHDALMDRHHQMNPQDPRVWLDRDFDHPWTYAIQGLGGRADTFFGLVKELKAMVEEWSLEQSTPIPSNSIRSSAPRL